MNAATGNPADRAFRDELRRFYADNLTPEMRLASKRVTWSFAEFEYGRQWVRDTSNTALGAIHAGHFELARAALRHMLTTMIAPDGATMIAGAFDQPDPEQFDQMGELLHVLKSFRDWTGDDGLIREHRTALLAMIVASANGVARDCERRVAGGRRSALGALGATDADTLGKSFTSERRFAVPRRRIRPSNLRDGHLVELDTRFNRCGVIAESIQALRHRLLGLNTLDL